MKYFAYQVRSACTLALCSTAWLVASAGALDIPPQVADSVTQVSAEPVESPVMAVSGWGEPVALSQLDDFRGGTDLVKNDMQLSATVANNSASYVVSGNNSIADGAFANMSGLPMVIQNSGSNVLIQNATIINVQFQ